MTLDCPAKRDWGEARAESNARGVRNGQQRKPAGTECRGEEEPVSASLPLPDDGARRQACVAAPRIRITDADPARVAPFDDPERSSGRSPKM